jgi:hypothetical protein
VNKKRVGILPHPFTKGLSLDITSRQSSGARLSSLRRIPLITAQSTRERVLLRAAVSRSAAGKLAAGEGRCRDRDAGYDEGRRNHESNDQLTHVSFLHQGLKGMLSTLPCKRGIAL